MNIEDVEVNKYPVILFMGTPDFSVPVLRNLINNYKVKAVITQTDKKIDRNGKIVKPPVKILAEENDILVLQYDRIKENIEEILALNPDLIITCAYGQILPKEILDYPKYGCINVHASLLPKLRGGAPIHRAIINGYKKTGVTIMYMAPGMDDGDIITQKEIEITDLDTASTLHDKLSVLGSNLLIETLPSILDGTNNRIPQNSDEVTFAPIIKPVDEKINFSKNSIQVYNQIRGLNSFPGAYFILNGKRIKVWESKIVDEYYSNKIEGEIVKLTKEGILVKTENSSILLTSIQPEGKSKMRAIDFINGYKEPLIGKVLN